MVYGVACKDNSKVGRCNNVVGAGGCDDRLVCGLWCGRDRGLGIERTLTHALP